MDDDRTQYSRIFSMKQIRVCFYVYFDCYAKYKYNLTINPTVN
jgi:hypothetical protein